MQDLVQRGLLDSFSLASIHSFINISLPTSSGSVQAKKVSGHVNVLGCIDFFYWILKLFRQCGMFLFFILGYHIGCC